MKLSLSHRSGFTLVELLVVLAIIGTLASMLFPVTGLMMERANNVKCLNNLRQMGAAAHMAANDNDNRFPAIEIDGKNPIFAPEDNAKPIAEALGKYGVTPAVLQCPSDLKAHNWFAQVGSSYMWQPYAEEELRNNIQIYSRRGQFPGKQSRVRLATDYEPVHAPDTKGARKKMNAVYADGHTASR